MPLDPADLHHLTNRVHAIAECIGWDLRFVEPDSEHVCLLAGAGSRHMVIFGPVEASALAVYDLDFELDAIELGDRRIVLDELGDPRLV